MSNGSCLYEFTVGQTIGNGFQIGSVSAYDPDGNSITYSIESDNSAPPFEFRETSIGEPQKYLNSTLFSTSYFFENV